MLHLAVAGTVVAGEATHGLKMVSLTRTMLRSQETGRFSLHKHQIRAVKRLCGMLDVLELEKTDR